MDPGNNPSASHDQDSVAEQSPPDPLWFLPLIPRHCPWGDEALLEEVPDDAKSAYGLRMASSAQLNGEWYREGEVVTATSAADLARILDEVPGSPAIFYPAYDRLIPFSWRWPHRRTIQLKEQREGLLGQIVKALLMGAGLVALGFVLPNFFVFAILAATMFGLYPLVEAVSQWFRRMDLWTVDELNRRLVNGELFYRWLRVRPRSTVLASVIFLGLIYLAQTQVSSARGGFNGSIELAALVKERVSQGGEWWRIVTTGLMHGSLLHVAMNGLALFSLGRVMRALAGPWVLAPVFLGSVITGSLASLWGGPGEASVGASGGILGILGFLILFAGRFRADLPMGLRSSLLQSTIVVALMGVLGVAFIDNAAHLGGYLGGMMMALLLSPVLTLAPERADLLIRLLGLASLVVLGAATGLIGMKFFG
jgi:membrane associated rhomboid family serine protease